MNGWLTFGETLPLQIESVLFGAISASHARHYERNNAYRHTVITLTGCQERFSLVLGRVIEYNTIFQKLCPRPTRSGCPEWSLWLDGNIPVVVGCRSLRI